MHLRRPEHIALLLVFGGRDFAGLPALFERLDALNPERVLHGGAPGADSLATAWARLNKKPVFTVRAPNSILNDQLIVCNPDYALMCPGGQRDMLMRVIRNRIPMERLYALEG